MCTCVEGNNVGLLCREHGEIPEQNSMVLGRFMVPSCVGLRDVLGGGDVGGWDGAVKFKGLSVGWGTDGRFQGLFIKCGLKISGLIYMVHG